MPAPDLSYKVEIALTSTWRTPAGSRVWTDISAYVERDDDIEIRYGRQDERDTPDANELTLLLDNSDGRFTVGNASSPYFPNVKLGRPIRVSASAGGVINDQVRYVGFINEWPVAWPGGSATSARTLITASSTISRVGTTAPLINPVDQSVESLGASFYWPLGEAEAATSGPEQRGRAAALVAKAPIVTGSDTLGLVDGRTGWKFTGSSDGVYGLTGIPFAATLADSFTVSFFAKVNNPGPDVSSSFGANDAGDFFQVLLSGGDTDVNPNTALGGQSYEGLTVRLGDPALSALYADGALHHYALVVVPNTATSFLSYLYRDGVQVSVGGGAPIGGASTRYVGMRLHQPRAFDGTGISRDVTVGRFAIFPTALSAAQVATLADGIDSYAGDTVAQRLARLSTWASIPTDLQSFAAGRITLGPLPPEGGQALDLLRRAEASDGGVLHDDRSGALRYRAIGSRYSGTSALTIDATTQRVGQDYAPKVDRSGLVNIANAKNSVGTVEATYTNEPSRTAYGDAGVSLETDALDENEPYALASWTVNINDEPMPRAPQLTIDVANWLGDTPGLSAILGLDIGSRITLSNLPSQAPATTVSYFVEGYTERIAQGSWRLTLNLSPTTAYDQVLLLDSPTRGLLDTHVLGL